MCIRDSGTTGTVSLDPINKISLIAKKYNVSTYRRPDRLALDETSTNEVILEFIEHLMSEGINFSNIITLQPTNPIRSEKLLLIAKENLANSNRKSLMSVSLLNKKFGRVIKNKYLPLNYKIGQRHQDLEHLYYENGLIYISSKEALLNEKEYISNDVYPLITDEIGSQIDIDYEVDLKLAELILKK